MWVTGANNDAVGNGRGERERGRRNLGANCEGGWGGFLGLGALLIGLYLG